MTDDRRTRRTRRQSTPRTEEFAQKCWISIRTGTEMDPRA